MRHQTLDDAVELAARAPSVHNTQPWRFVIRERQIELHSDLDRWLSTTDAAGRDLLVSCGAALHHLRVVLAASRMAADVRRLPDPAHSTHLATLTLDHHLGADVGTAEALACILRRRTDRRPFTNWPVPESFSESLVAAASEQGAVLRQVKEVDAMSALLDAVDVARTAQEGVADYVHEADEWTGREGADGIPRSNLLSDVTRVETARTFPRGDIDLHDRDLHDHAVLYALGTASDDRLSRLRAGEALSAVLLAATQHGLASCSLSQPLEVPASRDIIATRVLGGTLSPQILIRIGWAPPGHLPATQRRPLRDILG